jgi:ribonuclease P protein component
LIVGVRDRRTFVALRTDGVRVRRGALSVVFLDDDPDGDTRLAFAITKKVGGAVVRNRLRRRLRAICSDLLREQPDLVPGGALLVSAGPQTAERRSDELRNDVVRLLDDLRTRRSAGR